MPRTIPARWSTPSPSRVRSKAACSWVWAMRLPRIGRSRTACPRQGTVRSGCSVRPRFRISTPSTWRRTSCCLWHTAARASARSQRSPRRPPYRTPIARSTASCVRICPWWIRPTAAPVTAGRVERGRSLLTGCSRSASTTYAAPLAPAPSRAGAFCLERLRMRKLRPRFRLQNGTYFPDRASNGNCIPDSTLRMGFVFR